MLQSHQRSYPTPSTFTRRTAPFLVFALIFLSLTITAPFTSAAGSAPVVYSGDQWFGGTGVNVCTNTNGGGAKDFCGTERFVGGVAGARWQCVEFAQRFYQKMGWHTGMFSGVWLAHDLYDVATQNGFSRQANGDITDIQPGDMIVHHKDAAYTGGAGHVSIVDRISGSIVYAVEQNTGSPTAAYTLSGKTLNRQGLNMIRGIVKPKQHSSNHSSGEASSITYALAKDSSRRLFTGAANGSVHQLSWGLNSSSHPLAQEISKLPSPVTAITSKSAPNTHPEVYVGTESGALYRIDWSGEKRNTTRIASLGSRILSLESTLSPSGVTYVYSGTSNGRINATYWSNNTTPSTLQVASHGSAVNSLKFSSQTSNPVLYAGTQSGYLYQTEWNWSSLLYTSSQLVNHGSPVNSLEFRKIKDGNSSLYSATQDGSIYQTSWGDTPRSTIRLTRHTLPVTALTYDMSSDSSPRLYSATSDGRIHQTRWGDQPLSTTYFESVNGRINQMIHIKTNTGQPRIFSASRNGGIYQTHWGSDTKLGVLQLARP